GRPAAPSRYQSPLGASRDASPFHLGGCGVPVALRSAPPSAVTSIVASTAPSVPPASPVSDFSATDRPGRLTFPSAMPATASDPATTSPSSFICQSLKLIGTDNSLP